MDFVLFPQVWVKSSSNISPFVFKKASGTKAGVLVVFCVLLIADCDCVNTTAVFVPHLSMSNALSQKILTIIGVDLPLASTCPHLRCDVVLEGQNCAI